ncbi:MAG: Calx-beta domain-containing protein [Acidimicrobiales bacterium]|nr:Calx-beta domain-containing protein [Acidimicrobiales bacterium]
MVPLTIYGDTVDEPGQAFGAEWVAVAFSTPTNAVFGTGLFAQLGLALIVDDDPTPTLEPGSATIAEGDSGTAVLEVPVTLSAPSANTVTVDWQTVDTDQPEPGIDFESASGTLTFAPGETSATIAITVIGDIEVEPGQLFGAEWGFIELSQPTNAAFGTGLFARHASFFIIDDD